MGIREQTSHPTENNKVKENFIKNELFEITDKHTTNIGVNKSLIETSKFQKIDPHILNVSKSICKIEIITGQQIIRGTGFLLRFNIDQEPFYCLISNEHVITKKIINNNTNISVSYDSEFKTIILELDTTKRYIKSFTDIGLDITVVEILEEDGIYRDYFFMG